MAKRSARERLSDIVASIEKVDRFLANETFESFSANELIRDAVIRNLEIVSEASRHVPPELKAAAPQIAWREIADFGNWLRHGYDGVDDHILWDTIQRDLPALLVVVRNFLERPEE